MRVQTFIPKDYDVFAGLDVDNRSSSVTVTDHQGFRRSLRMPYRVAHLVNHVRQPFAGQKIAFAYAAGPTGYGLSDGLVAHAYPCLIASPSMSPKAPGQRVKTNRLDSRGLAESLGGGPRNSVHVPAPCYRALRPLPQRRATCGSERVAMKLRLKSRLLLAGLEFPPAPAGRQCSVLVKETLRKLPGSTPVRFQLDQWLDRVAFHEQPGVKTTKEIRRFCRTDAARSQCVRYLLTIPGIGWIVARQLLARIGAGRELRNIRQLAGFLGVVPTEHSTGDRAERGSIPHTGDARLRSNLIQAAWSAIRHDGELREFFRAVCQTHPRPLAARVAIVAVARTLSVGISVVLMKQRPYAGRAKGHSAPLTPAEPMPQGTTRRLREPGEQTA